MTNDAVFSSAVWQPPWVYQCNYLHGCVTSSYVSTAQGLLMVVGAQAGGRASKPALLSLPKVLELDAWAGLQPEVQRGHLRAALRRPIPLRARSSAEGSEAGYRCIALYFQQQGNKTMTSRVRLSSYVCFDLFVFSKTRRFLWIKGWRTVGAEQIRKKLSHL